MEIARQPDPSRIVAIWFGFHPRESLRAAWLNRRWTIFGHVECWGVMDGGLFFGFDPRAAGTRLWISADPAAFDRMAAQRFLCCTSVIRFRPAGQRIGIPLHPMMNCAAQCAHLVGLRAYSPRSLRRILTANGGTETGDGTEGGSPGEGDP
jgi:hypothetical protein